MSSKLALLMTAALPLALGGCLNEPIGSRDAGLGEAFKYDMAIQTINPEPVYPPTAAKPGSNGDVGAQSVQRYREGKVTPVQSETTSTGTAGSGGSGGSGMSGGPQ